MPREPDFSRGLDALRRAVLVVLPAGPALGRLLPAEAASPGLGPSPWLHADSLDAPARVRAVSRGTTARGAQPVVSPTSLEAEQRRLRALVDLARDGDADAFGLLYDHYHVSIYRFVYYRVGAVPLAEDLTSETFLRALRNLSSFTWQGKDFGAWLTTIARNLVVDHYKAGRTRLERPTDDMTPHSGAAEGPEPAVMTSLTNEALLGALSELPTDQQECLVMRFLQGLSTAETAAALGRSQGAVKQLQLRAVRSLAKRLPQDLR